MFNGCACDFSIVADMSSTVGVAGCNIDSVTLLLEVCCKVCRSGDSKCVLCVYAYRFCPVCPINELITLDRKSVV